MGVTEAKPKILNQRIMYKYDRLNIDQLDKIFNDSFPIVKEVEILRCEFLLRWNEFVRHSGGIVLLNPSFESCIQGMLWKLATDLNGRISSVQIFESDPYIQINEPCKTEDQILSQTFTDICRFWAQNDERVRRLEIELGKSFREAIELKKDPETLLTDQYNVRPIDVYSYRSKILANNKKIFSAHEAIRAIRQTFDDIQRGLINYSVWTKSKDRQRRVEDVAASAIQKKYTKAPRIVYKFSKEDRVSSYDDHLDLVQDDLKAEKEARYVLQELGLPVTPTTVTKIYTKKEERLPTGATAGSAMRKETEASITEQIEQPIETVRESQVIRERETPKAYTNIVKNSVAYVNNVNKVNSVNNVNSLPSAKEKTTYIREDQVIIPEKTKVVGVKLPSAERENIENISPNVQTRPAYKKIMTMPEMNKEMVERVPQREDLARSETYEQPDLRQSTVTIDVDSLQREIETLRRENRNLSAMNERLTQSTLQPRTMQISKEEEVVPFKKSSLDNRDRQKDVPSTTSINKPLVFVKNHIALKSWALTLRKSLKVIEDSAKCMEAALDLELIAVGSRNGKVSFFRFLNFSDIREVASIQISHEAVTSLLYLCDGKTLLCGTRDGLLVSIDLKKFSHNELMELEAPISAIVNPLKGHTYFISADKRIYQVDILNNFITNVTDAHDELITCMSFDEKKQILCTGSKDKNIKIWNASSMECLGELQGHNGPIKSLCFAYSQNQLLLCSVSKDSTLIFWNLADKNLTKSITCDTPANKVVYLHDKRSVLTLHKSGRFHLWNTEKIAEKEFFSNKAPYTTGCYYDDGHNILLANSDGELEFWNAK